MKKGILHKPETAVDVFKLLPEGVLCQVINNTIYMSPAPSYEHQAIIGKIQFGIMGFLQKNQVGECVAGPVDVFLNQFNAFQPDLLFISTANLSIIEKGKIYGAPDLVIEVLSPGNAGDDKVKKRKVYEQCGVKEYFIVSPSSKEVVSYYHNGKKFEKGPAQKGKITSRILKRTFKF